MNTQIQGIKKNLRIITIILVGLTLLTPFIFSGDFFFPFITSKAFFMRTMIILSSVSYVGLFLIDKNSRPKRSLMLYAVMSFLIILILATINSIDPTRSMWSNFERMEGLVTMLYMGALFVVASSTIRKNEWTYIMNTSIAISLVVGIQALSNVVQGTDRISGHLGNSSYLGVYALIHIFFGMLGAMMIFRGNREKELMSSGDHKSSSRLSKGNYTYIVLYLLTAIFNLFILYKTGTRGSFVGLVAGLVLASIYLAWKEKNKTIRYSAIGFLTAVVLSISLLGIFKESNFVANNNLLSRFAALITWDVKSLLNNEGNARTMIWKMAFEGVKERPLLGWGQDNFGYVFSKYYNPHMYSQEQWFDRSHNVFMDWLIAAGILGLLGYLSLFVLAMYFIFSKKAEFTIVEKSILIGLLTSYFVHNVFVFDNLSSYVLFFLILAYINDRYTHDKNDKSENKILSENEKNTAILIGIISFLILSFVTYHTILKPYSQNKELIKTLRSTQTAGINVIDQSFKKVLDGGSTGRFETFEQLATLLPKIVSAQGVSTTTKQSSFSLFKEVVSEYDKELNQDARFNFFVSNTYRSLGLKDQSLIYADKAYNLSPQKQSFAYTKALLLVEAGDLQGAKVILKKAYEDAPENMTAYGYYIGILSDISTKSGNDLLSLGEIASALAEGYKKNKHDIIFKKDFWVLFTDKRVKDILVNRLIELIPEGREKILNSSK